MEFTNFMNSLLTNLIPQNFEVGQTFYLEVHVQNAMSLSILDGLQQTRAQNLT